jgi:hypothetical protein
MIEVDNWFWGIQGLHRMRIMDRIYTEQLGMGSQRQTGLSIDLGSRMDKVISPVCRSRHSPSYQGEGRVQLRNRRN